MNPKGNFGFAHFSCLGEPHQLRNKLLLLVSSALIAFSIATGGGGDWTGFFVPFASGDLDAAFHPYHLQILLYPFQHFPYYIWSVITILILTLAASKLGTNPVHILLTLPGVALIWAGQIDSFIIAAVILVLSSNSPLLAGISLILFSTKPHVTWLAGLTVTWIYRRSLLKLFAFPLLFAALSFFLYGVDWPIRWYMSIPTTINSNYGYKPIFLAVFLLPIPFFLKEHRKQLLAAFCISALLVPVGIYSFVNFLVIFCPAWLIPVTWSVYILHNMGNIAFIVPIAVLIGQFFPDIVKIIKHQRSRFIRDEQET